MEDCLPAPDAGSEDVTRMLREQLQACHELAKACFARSKTENDLYYGVKEGRLTLGARLVKTSTALALALKRLEADAAKPTTAG